MLAPRVGADAGAATDPATPLLLPAPGSNPGAATHEARPASHGVALTAPAEEIIVAPQPGGQEKAMASPADIVVFGGKAFAGKTWCLQAEVLRHSHVPGFDAAIFRETSPELTNPGGLWPESYPLYMPMGAQDSIGNLSWTFDTVDDRGHPARPATVKFAHCQYDNDVYKWQGAQICYLGIDQAERFSEFKVFYLLSRNRSTSGVRPYCRMTCNPDPDSWLAKFIAWWIDQDTGFPDAERDGVVRWFVRVGDTVATLEWFDTREAAIAFSAQRGIVDPVTKLPIDPLSVAFVAGDMHENTIGLGKDPGYPSRLMAMPLVERMRLLGGNWKIRPTAGKVYNRAWFKSVKAAPVGTLDKPVRRVRYWDKAGTENTKGKAHEPARTAGVKLALDADGNIFVEHAIAGWWGSHERNRIMEQTAHADGPGVTVWVEQEPGSGGKESAEISIKELAGYRIHADKVTGDKILRSGPLSAQAEGGNVYYVVGEWNEAWLDELHAFPDRKLKDLADATAGAYNKLVLRKGLVVA